MEAVSRRSTLSHNLPHLQDLIKRDRFAYKEEFLQQYQHYQALLRLFLVDPTQESLKFQEIVTFLSQVCHCYPEETSTFPVSIQYLLQQHGSVLHSELRLSLCRALVLMRNKEFVDAASVLPLFFELFRCQDKTLRKVLYTHVVSDIKKINSKRKDAQANKDLQNFMYTMVKDTNLVASKMSLDVIIEMYRRNVWKDAKTVNVMTTACFSPFTKVVTGALQFFLSDDGSTETMDAYSSEEDSDGETSKAIRKIMLSKRVTKRGKKNAKKVAKVLAKRKKNKKHKAFRSTSSTFSALHLINDPQSFAEELFKKLEHSKEKFEVRFLMMSLISRLIGLHRLFLFSFYPFLQRYLQPHQQEVTKVLTFLAQASHELVPAEVLEPSIRAIVMNFICERNSSEVMAVGLNAVREVCIRCPLSMTSELLHDLSSFKSHHNKSVMMAARSLIQLFRDLNPQMLKRKDRGKPVEFMELHKVRDYGELIVSEYVPGSELVDLPCDDQEDSSQISCLIELCEEKPKLAREEVQCLRDLYKEKAIEISHSRILSQEDFEAIRLNQVTPKLSSRSIKQVQDLLHSQEKRREATGEILSESAIETVDHKKQRLDKEGRLAVVQSGRAERKSYGYHKRRMRFHGSTAKNKNKPFMMIKHTRTVRGRNKKSFREKQMALKHSLLKQKKAK